MTILTATVTVTAKGQITLKKDLLRHLGVAPGDKLDVVALAGGRLEINPLRGDRSDGLEAFFGAFKNERKIHASLDDINDAIKAGWAGEVRFEDDP